MWAVVEAGGAVHVVPCADLVHHELGESCVCGPTPELVHRDLGPEGWMYTHHSLDGREATEEVT